MNEKIVINNFLSARKGAGGSKLYFFFDYRVDYLAQNQNSLDWS